MPDPSPTLQELLLQALDLLDSEGEPGLERLCAQVPAQATRLRRRVAAMRAVGLIEGLGASAAPERLGEFRLLEPLGAGGMGIVYRAVQEGLGREVALKVIRPEHMYFPGARERFQREVEIVAKLQHPGIVPIYTVGEEQGVPYFAMELLAGANLATLLARVRDTDPRTLQGIDLAPDAANAGYLFSGSWEEACLRIIRQVAEAVDHAHRREVWHRDIKPSNVLVTSGAASRAVLLDFGLAASTGSGRITRSGSQLGSLQYMSPEQARGDVRELGPQGDVYQLGATLYELLALQPAYAGNSDAQVLAAIESGAPRHLRELNPLISWEAETVCLTAMDVDPSRRYASASDLARDLGNVLDRRPIEARRIGVGRRLQRWMQRNPAAALAAALSALLLVGGPTAYAWQQRRSSIALEGERDRAEKNLERALEAVDRMLARVADADLRLVPQMGSVRKALLQDAVALLERFVADESGNPRVSLAVANAYKRLGRLNHDLGRHDQAELALSKSIAALEIAMGADPADEALRELWLNARISLADNQAQLARHAEAVEALQAVDVDLEAALARHPDRLSLQQVAISLHTTLGKSLQELERVEESLAVLTDAAEHADRLLLAHPPSISVYETAAQAWDALGYLLIRKYSSDGQGNPEAERALARGVEIARLCVEQEPDDPHFATALAVMQINYAGALRRSQRYGEARAIYEDARDSLEQVTRDFPDNISAALHLATAYNQLALLGDYLRDADSAIPNYRRTIELLEVLVARAPNEPMLWDRYAQAQANLSAPLRHLGRNQEAERALVGAVEAARRSAQLAPDSQEAKSDLSIHSSWLARVRCDLGLWEAAAQAAAEMTSAHPVPWESWSGAAIELAHVVAGVRQDSALTADERAALEAKYAAQAIGCLRAAVVRDLPGSRDLRTIAALSGLFGVEEFEAYADERMDMD